MRTQLKSRERVFQRLQTWPEIPLQEQQVGLDLRMRMVHDGEMGGFKAAFHLANGKIAGW